MRFTQVAPVRPSSCACIPYLGSHHPGGYFDFGTEMRGDGHVYVSLLAAQQMAKAMKWGPIEERGMRQELEAERLKVAALEKQVERLEGQLDAVAILKNDRFVQQGMPGRPRKVGV